MPLPDRTEQTVTAADLQRSDLILPGQGLAATDTATLKVGNVGPGANGSVIVGVNDLEADLTSLLSLDAGHELRIARR